MSAQGTEFVPPSRTEPPRDQWGRYLLPTAGGARVAHQRVTTLVKTIRDTFLLEAWSQRMVAVGIGLRPDLHALAASLDPQRDKKALDRLVQEAKDAAGAKTGANLGTALHAFAERIDRGEPVEVPAPWDQDIAGYKALCEKHNIRMHPWWVERILFHPDLLVAGTCDRLVWLPDQPSPLIADIKTGSFLAFDEIAMQLACYARAPKWYDVETDTVGDVPPINQDIGIIIHLPSGGTPDLFYVDLRLGWEGVQLAVQVRAWQKRQGFNIRWGT